MVGDFSAVIILRAAVAKGRARACESDIGSAAACCADARAADSSIDDRQGGEDRKKD
jgi:hypothetical protein